MVSNNNKERFLDLINTINRPGIGSLISWLITSDFFVAPASTVFHQNYEGGLCEHSLAVYDALVEETKLCRYSDETLKVVALLHDLCKVNCYVRDMRNVKNAYGKWEQVPYYRFVDNWGMGHGECSMWLASKFIALSDEEAAAISSHMGGFDSRAKGGSNCVSIAFEKYPLAVLLHIADLKSSYLFSKSS